MLQIVGYAARGRTPNDPISEVSTAIRGCTWTVALLMITRVTRHTLASSSKSLAEADTYTRPFSVSNICLSLALFNTLNLDMEQQAKATPEIRKVAVFLRSGKAGIKVRVGALNGKRFDYFKGLWLLPAPAFARSYVTQANLQSRRCSRPRMRS